MNQWPAHLPRPERLPSIEDHARALSEWRCLNDKARIRARTRLMLQDMGREVPEWMR